MREEWIVPWAMWIWAALFLAIIVFEIIMLIMNSKIDDGSRRNLTAYTRAFFGVGDRRLSRRLPLWIFVAFWVWLGLHFAGVID
jgi:hypothetical protein